MLHEFVIYSSVKKKNLRSVKIKPQQMVVMPKTAKLNHPEIQSTYSIVTDIYVYHNDLD